jgi:hypothetical protein
MRFVAYPTESAPASGRAASGISLQFAVTVYRENCQMTRGFDTVKKK